MDIESNQWKISMGNFNFEPALQLKKKKNKVRTPLQIHRAKGNKQIKKKKASKLQSRKKYRRGKEKEKGLKLKRYTYKRALLFP